MWVVLRSAQRSRVPFAEAKGFSRQQWQWGEDLIACRNAQELVALIKQIGVMQFDAVSVATLFHYFIRVTGGCQVLEDDALFELRLVANSLLHP